jgi:hypothetical protein
MNKLFDRPVALTIGPAGCGTPWIYDYMRVRGDVCLPSGVREIFYFDRHFQRGPEFYAAHFQPEERHKLIMEITTTAFDNPDAPDHVLKLLGADVQLICPLRHPVERAKAMYADYIRYGLVKGGIEEAVEQVPQILLASRYSERLEPWLNQFGPENVHIVFYEKLKRDATGFAEDLCKLLDLPFAAPPPTGGVWAGLTGFIKPKKPAAPPITRQDEAWLKSRLDSEVPALQKRLGKSLNYWK